MGRILSFRDLLEYLTITNGDLLYIHSSYSRMKTFNLSAYEIIEQIINKVGTNGTVAFPSFSWNIEPTERPWKGYEKYFFSDIVFDLHHTKSNMGYISEIFRTYRGVLRSVHPFWSICAIGSLARVLVENQEFIEHPYGPLSSFVAMKDNNVKLVGFGVTLNTTSLCPIVDFDLGQDHTQNVFTNYKVKTKVINSEGNEMECSTYTMLPEAVRNIRPIKVFDTSEELRNKLTYIEQDRSYFFSYNFLDFYNVAMKLGRESIELGQQMPWLDLLPIRTRG